MHRQGTNKESRFSRRWVTVVALMWLISSLGCSLAPLTGLTRRLEPLVLAAGPGEVADPRRLELATRTPWPTFTPTVYQSPTALFTSSPTPTPTDTAAPTSTPTPTSNPIPTGTATAAATPIPSVPPAPTRVPAPAPPTAMPTPTFTPTPGYAYQAVETYEDYTSNWFLTGYIAVVNYQEIPIGGVKAVGTFEPGGAYHESPLSKWFFEGYSAPGPVIKSSSVKFEPPGGIQEGTWSIHLEDEWGTRLSEDVSITTDPDTPRWFFVKFKQPTPSGARAAAPSRPSNPILARVPTPVRNNGAAPTATRTTPARWSFVGTRLVIDQNQRSMIVYGDVVNNTGSSQRIIYVTGIFYDNQGRIIAGVADTEDYLPFEFVPSGGRIPFKLTVYDTQGVSDFDLSVASQPSSATPRQDFELSNLEPSGEAGDYCVAGRLQNPGSQLLDNLVVVAVLYDAEDNVINFDRYEAPSPQDVVGDQTLDFEICVDTLDQGVARYEVQAFGQ